MNFSRNALAVSANQAVRKHRHLCLAAAEKDCTSSISTVCLRCGPCSDPLLASQPAYLLLHYSADQDMKQTSCVRTDRWINIWCVRTLGFYVAIKKISVSLAGKCMELEIIRCDVSQKRRQACCVFSHVHSVLNKHTENTRVEGVGGL